MANGETEKKVSWMISKPPSLDDLAPIRLSALRTMPQMTKHTGFPELVGEQVLYLVQVVGIDDKATLIEELRDRFNSRPKGSNLTKENSTDYITKYKIPTEQKINSPNMAI